MIGDNHIRNDRRGFTLMELLVVLGIFSITVVMASGIFLLANRAQRRVLASTAAQNDVRFALEGMIRQVRTGKIDYTTYAAAGGIPIPTDQLIVLDATGARQRFYLETSSAVCPAGIAKCLALSINGGTSQAVSSAGIFIDKLAFFISPQQDPFSQGAGGLYGSNVQPTVTIAIQARTVNAGTADLITLNAQTTAAARTYAR